jgi:hypothetical protein
MVRIKTCRLTRLPGSTSRLLTGARTLRNVSTTMIQPGSKFKLGSSTLVDDLDEFRHSARRVLLAELEIHQTQATH